MSGQSALFLFGLVTWCGSDTPEHISPNSHLTVSHDVIWPWYTAITVSHMLRVSKRAYCHHSEWTTLAFYSVNRKGPSLIDFTQTFVLVNVAFALTLYFSIWSIGSFIDNTTRVTPPSWTNETFKIGSWPPSVICCHGKQPIRVALALIPAWRLMDR